MCGIKMNKMALCSTYGNMISKKTGIIDVSEIVKKLEQELSKKIYGCVNCRIDYNYILISIDYEKHSYFIELPIDFSTFGDEIYVVSKLVEDTSKRYFDIVYRERFRKLQLQKH